MRRSAVVMFLPLLLAAGCSGGGGGGTREQVALPTVSGPFGAKPSVVIPAGKPSAEPRVKVVIEGTGPEVKQGQVVVADVGIKVWQGNRDYLNSYDTMQPTTIALSGQSVSRTWDAALLGKRAGSRVVLVSPATQGFGPGGMAPSNVSPTDTLVVVFDIIGSYAPKAQVSGAAAAQGRNAALPAVAIRPGKAPDITVPKGVPAPTKLVDTTLVQGQGPVVQPGQTVVVQYTSAIWEGGVEFDSTLNRRGPNGFILKPASTLPGWVQGLAGKRVGSRVLLVVPKAMGRGFQHTLGGATAPANSTMVYTIDLLDAH